MRCRHHVVLGYTPYILAALVASYCQGETTTVTDEGITAQDSTLKTTTSVQSATTEKAAPDFPTEIASNTINSTAIQLKWNQTSDSWEFLIKWQALNDESDSGNLTVSENVTDVTISGLRVWTEYNFTVIASRDELSSEPVTIIERTDAEAPGPPEDFRALTSNSSAIVLTWMKPNDTNGPLDGYNITWSKTNEEQEYRKVDGNCTETIVTGLDVWTDYIFTIVAYRKSRKGILKSDPVTQSNRTDPEAPGPPEDFRTLTRNSSAIALTWKEPNDTNGPVAGYNITWRKTDEELEYEYRKVDGNCTETIVTGLDIWTNYTFTIVAYSESRSRVLKSDPVTQSNRTDPEAPGPPEDFRTLTWNSSAIALTWKEPNDTNGPLDGYNITWSKTNEEQEYEYRKVDGDCTETIVTGLDVWTDYIFTIVAYSESRKVVLKSDPVTQSNRTDPEAPCPPSGITLSSINSSSVTIEWKEPHCKNGPLDGYEIRWTNKDDGLGSNETIFGSNVTFVEIHSLACWTEYTFFVLAFNRFKDGRLKSGEVNDTIRTNPSDPRMPTDLTLTYNETNMHAAWSYISPTNCAITGYNISWQKEGICGSNQSLNPWITTVETEYLVTNLPSGTNYSFSVYAFTEWEGAVYVGSTVCQYFKTDDGYPLRPENVTCMESNSSAIAISWDEPEYRGEILSYTVSYHKMEPHSNTSESMHTPDRNVTIENLEPHTSYQISVSAWTSKGQGNWSIPKICDTKPAIPNTPSGIYTKAENESIWVTWNASTPYPGPITYHVVTYKTTNNCGAVIDEPVNIQIKPENVYREANIRGLQPYTEYNISIIAETEAGQSGAAWSKPVRTLPSRPSAVVDLRVNCSFSSNMALLSWLSPVNPNGEIKSYIINFEGRKDGKGSYMDEKKIKGSNERCKRKEFSTSITSLLPEYTYTFFVSAMVDGVEKNGPLQTMRCTLPAGFPPPPRKNISVVERMKEEIVFVLDKDTFLDTGGDIVKYAVVVADAKNIGSSEIGARDSEKLPTWSQFQKNDSVLRYQATPENWNPFNVSAESHEDPLRCKPSNEKRNANVKKCTLGCQVECDAITYCNGPLTPGMSYGLKIRGYTKTGFSETLPVVINTKSEEANSSNGKIITAVVVTTFVILALFAGVLAYRRYGAVRLLKSSVMSRTPPASNDVLSFTPSVTQTRPVELSRFSKLVSTMMADSALKFSQEFEELKAISPTHPCTAAQLPDNRPKNRWINILPFDHSRVKLLPVDDEPASDYINGSYIPGYTCHREYIATQGPLPGTVDDMWRMIWEQGVNMIVMLTQCVERGKTKCEQYWPTEKQCSTYGDLKVQTMSESVLSEYTIRTFDLSLNNRHRVITHLHFTKWPDFGCPENTELLINFVRAVREHMTEGDPSPFLIHCSAGVGRTGTFIAVDRLMQHVLLHNYVDIFQTVLDMREHRTNMVQTEDQYIYIHECVRDLIQQKLATNCDSFKDDELYGNIGVHITTNI